MLATIGYIAPEYFRLPGYCSPSAGLGWARFVRFGRVSRTDTRKSPCLFEQKPRVKMVADRPELHCPRSQSSHRPAPAFALADLKFADIPNGVQALYKMPAEAWSDGGLQPVEAYGLK